MKGVFLSFLLFRLIISYDCIQRDDFTRGSFAKQDLSAESRKDSLVKTYKYLGEVSFDRKFYSFFSLLGRDTDGSSR